MIRLATKAVAAIVIITGAHYHLAGHAEPGVVAEEQDPAAEYKASAHEPTTVIVHLDNLGFTGGVIGGFRADCNILWFDGCPVPVRALERVLFDEGELPAGGLRCRVSPVTIYDLEECFPAGWDVLPSPNGLHLYLTSPESRI